MDDSHFQQRTDSSDLVEPNEREEDEVVEELILDYACKNNMEYVISDILHSKGQNSYRDLRIPHLRILAATLYSVVHAESFKKFDHVLKNLQIIQDAKSDLVSAKHFVKLTAGLKTKVILSRLEAGFDYASVCAKLNQYFPKAELHAPQVNREQAKLNNYQLHLRRKLTRLIVSPSERQAFQQGDGKSELGLPLTASIKDLVTVYTNSLNDNLTIPVIEQIASEGPHSQISKDVEDSPTSCMDRLLAMCFKGPPSEDQLLLLLSLIKEKRAKGSDIAESDVRLSSSSGSSDERGQQESARIRAANQRRQVVTTTSQGNSRHGDGITKRCSSGSDVPGSTSLNRNGGHNQTTKDKLLVAIADFEDYPECIDDGVTCGTHSRAPIIVRNKDVAESKTPGKEYKGIPSFIYSGGTRQTFPYNAPVSSSAVYVVTRGIIERQALSDAEPSENTRSEHSLSRVMTRNRSNESNAEKNGALIGVSTDQRDVSVPVVAVGNQPASPSKSRIYLSRTSARVSRSQSNRQAAASSATPAESVVKAVTSPTAPQNNRIYYGRTRFGISRSQPTRLESVAPHRGGSTKNQPCVPSTSLVNRDNPAIRHTTVSKASNNSGIHRSELVAPALCTQRSSSGSSTQSMASLSLLSGKGARVINHVTKTRGPVDATEKERDPQWDEYTGSITIIDETPSSGEVNTLGLPESPPDQCNIISSSGSSGFSLHSLECKENSCEATGAPEKTASNASFTLDASMFYRKPTATMQSSTEYTFIRPSPEPTQDYSSHSTIILTSSDSDNDSVESVVSDSEESNYSEEETECSSETCSPASQSRRRIPSLSGYLQSPVKQVTSTSPVSVLIIKPCAVVLHRLKAAEIHSYTQVRRRSKRRRQKAH